MAYLASCRWQWFRPQLQTPALLLVLFICSRAAAVPQLCRLGCRKAKEVRPAVCLCQEREVDHAGSYHLSNPDLFAPRWKLHTSTPQYVLFFLVVENHMLLNLLPCFANIRENLYLWTCSRSKNQLVKIQLKQYFTQSKGQNSQKNVAALTWHGSLISKSFSC